jgi:hypothetical protein
MTRIERRQLASKRLQSVLSAQIVANARTLENKISDAGPSHQRIEPHILTPARQALEKTGRILRTGAPTIWFHLADAPPDQVEERLLELRGIHDQLARQSFTLRLGQCLEIAVFNALRANRPCEFLGSFADLQEHDDSTPYSKEEPPNSISGDSIPGKKRLDFLLLSEHGRAGVETKNIREWLYPHSVEVRELLLKCCAIDAVPVLIARRLPYITFSLLSACGVILHQTYNQLFPSADAELATKAKNKNLLGYHDIRVGNEPDSRLAKFIRDNLPKILPAARTRFRASKDLLQRYGSSEIEYFQFAKQVIRSRRQV